MGAHSATLKLHVIRGSTLHGVLCDAFLDAWGYVAIDGALYELLTVDLDEAHEDAFAWVARRARYAGAA